MDKDLREWAISVLQAADECQCQRAGTSVFSSVLAANESEIEEKVNSLKDDNAIYAEVCNALAENPELAADLAAQRDRGWRYPLKALAQLNKQCEGAGRPPASAKEKGIKLMEVVLQAVRAVVAEFNEAIDSVGPGKGVWKVRILGNTYRIPGNWDRRKEVAQLYSEKDPAIRQKLTNISGRLERAYTASEVAFETFLELDKLVQAWNTWEFYLTVRMAFIKLHSVFFEEQIRFSQLMRTKRADEFVSGMTEVALSTRKERSDGFVVEGLDMLATMLECADDLSNDYSTRRNDIMVETIKVCTKGHEICSGRLLFEKVEKGLKQGDDNVLDPLLLIVRHACEDFRIHNRLSRLGLPRLISSSGGENGSEDEAVESTGVDDLFADVRLDHVRCENRGCGKLLKRSPRCTKCLHAFYCGKDCQVEDFPVHKSECLALKKCKRCQQI